MRKIQKFCLVALVLAVAISIAGCGGSSNRPSGGNIVGVNPGESGADYTLASNAYHFAPGGPIEVVTQTPTTMTLSKPINLPIGAVILSSFGKGALVKVVSIHKTATTTEIQTTQASLAEAFSKLSLDGPLPLNETVSGPLKSDVPDVSTTWIVGSDPKVKDVIHVDFGSSATALSKRSSATTSTSYYHGIGVGGSVDVKLNPYFNPVVQPDANGKGQLISLEMGLKPTFHGTLLLQQKYSGTFSQDAEPFVDKDLPSFPAGPLVITPHLTIKSAVSGKASFAFGAGVRCDSEYTAGLKFHDGNIDTINIGNTMSSPEITVCKGTFDFDVRPVDVSLTFLVDNVSGPSVGAFVGGTGEGKAVANVSGQDTKIHAEAGCGLYLAVGLKGNATLVKLLDGVLGFLHLGQLPTVEKNFQILGEKLEKDFLIKSDVNVGDDGPAADDVFEVTVDGALLGSTFKGQTNQFPISDLSPGNHTLHITCTDDGDNGNDVGTLGVSLFDGLTFADGSTTFSGDINQGASIDLTVVVPDVLKPSLHTLVLTKRVTNRRGK